MTKKIITMTNNISDHYNKIYSGNKTTFGTEPIPLVEKVLEYIKSGKVIEFGAGEGRNSLFLASKGFQVVAVDISPVAIEKINEKAKIENIVLETKVADIVQIDFVGPYDLMVCTFTLHHLTREQAIKFIEKTKQSTKSGGYNLITSFTQNGDFYRKDPTTGKFYLKENELKDLYQDWEVLTYFEKKAKAFAKNPDGTPMVNVFAGMIAKRI